MEEFDAGIIDYHLDTLYSWRIQVCNGTCKANILANGTFKCSQKFGELRSQFDFWFKNARVPLNWGVLMLIRASVVLQFV